MKNNNNSTENWTFFSNNAHVLVCLSQTPQPTARQIAALVGITERAVQRILAKLIRAGIVSIGKEGRRNRYQLNLDHKLRHPLESHKTIGEFISLIDGDFQVDK